MFAFVRTPIGSVIAVNRTVSETVTTNAVLRRVPIILIKLTAVVEMVTVINPFLVTESHVRAVRVPPALNCMRARIQHVAMNQLVAVSPALA